MTGLFLGRLTLDFDRVSPRASTQTYSAMMEPFWSSLRYLLSWKASVGQQRYNQSLDVDGSGKPVSYSLRPGGQNFAGSLRRQTLLV